MILTLRNPNKETPMLRHLKHAPVTIAALLLTFFFVVSSVAADGIKDRMKNRLPAINALKDQGVIGENNKGYLEFKKSEAAQKQLVDEENDDRLKVYTAIARQQGATPELVGSRRAIQIAEIASPGTWLQKPDGSWYQK